MSLHRRTWTFAAVLAAAVAATPVSAHAATRTVYMGVPTKQDAKTFQKANSDVNNFFPQGVTIHAGDSVRFAPTGFHTIDFPVKGRNPLGLVAPTGQKISGANDAAGNPFWFNGQSGLSFNPALFKFIFGKTVSYTGAKQVESGLPVQNHPKAITVKFPKSGSYTYYCNIHPGMKGTVRVVSAKKAIPSVKAVAKLVRNQVAADLKTAKKLASTKPPASTVSVGASGPGGVEYYGFFPNTLTIDKGTTLHFTMSSATREDHTATIGPDNPETQQNGYLGKLAATFNSPTGFDPAAVYPSDQPGGTPADVSPTLHGNGFWNSGVLDNSASTPTLPASNSATFNTSGTYQVYCLIHPFMHGTITVR
jgi:plastocyanin